MAARAIWKGVIRFGDVEVPVKLYSAIESRSVQFRLLHEPDRVPVKQRMVRADSGEPIEYEEIRKGFPTDEGAIVMLAPAELDALEPEASREIEVTRFVRTSAINDQWYDRPYYLGPDENAEAYFALVAALERAGVEGVAHWVMRKKRYVGSLRLRDGHPMLYTLRYAEEVIPVSALEPPAGRDPEPRELEMASQLISMLEDEFDPIEYEETYRQRVLELIEAKARGGTIEFETVERERPPEELADALAASLQRAKELRSA